MITYKPRPTGRRRRLLPGVFLFAACGMVLAFLRAAAPSVMPPQVGASSKPAPPRVLEVWGGETVLAYDDYEGTFQVKAVGDRGSVHETSYRFNGFYVRPILTLSKALQGQFGTINGTIPGVDKYIDIYEIAPKSITAYIHSAATRWCVAPENEIHTAFTGLINKAFVCPEPPPPDAAPGASTSVMAWMYKRTNDFERTGYEVSIRVHSRQAAGGGATLKLHTHAMPQGQNTYYQTRTRTSPHAGHMQFSTRDAGEVQLSVSTGGFFWTPAHLAIGKPFGIEDISLAFDGSADYRTKDCSVGFTTASDTAYHLDYHFRIAGKMKIEADLEPVDPQEASWAPRPDDRRSFKLTLKDPGPESVQAVRFTLLETSSHPGVASNAGNHGLGLTCQDCDTRKTEVSGRTVDMGGVGGHSVSVPRAYFFYNECPIDSLPDMFFRSGDNDGYEMGQEASTPKGLKYAVSRQIVKKTGIGATETISLRVKDGAASAKLQAEIMVGGLWYPATAVGKTASGDEQSLLLPLDKDVNGIHDDFQTIWGVDNPDGDSESHTGGKFYGDGLTVFEEYRGVFIQGRHKRLSPLHKDLFVHDYSGLFTAALAAAAMKYQGHGIDVWALRQAEHRKDVVNWQAASHTAGSQYMLVIMTLAQTPGLDLGGYGGIASNVGPPTESHNTIVMSSAPPAGTYADWIAGSLAHEIGHNVNCPHHGTGEGYRQLAGAAGEVFVACLQGQHSGERDCIMAYNAAEYFFSGRPVPASGLDALLIQGKVIPYPDPLGTRRAFCATTKGTGVAGNAESGAGNCLAQIKIKSY